MIYRILKFNEKYEQYLVDLADYYVKQAKRLGFKVYRAKALEYQIMD